MNRALLVSVVLLFASGCAKVPTDPDKPADEGGTWSPCDTANPTYQYPVAAVTAKVQLDRVSLTWTPNKSCGIAEYLIALRGIDDATLTYPGSTGGTSTSWQSPPLDDGKYRYEVTARDLAGKTTPLDSMAKASGTVTVSALTEPTIYLYPRTLKVSPSAACTVFVKAANFAPDLVQGVHLALALPTGVAYTTMNVEGFLKDGAASVLHVEAASPGSLIIDLARLGNRPGAPNGGGSVVRVLLQAGAAPGAGDSLRVVSLVRDVRNQDVFHQNRGAKVEVK